VESALPERIINVLYEQKTSLNPAPYLIFDNLPLDDTINYNPNPNVYDPNAKSGCISENLLIAFASILGEPYSISFEGGDIVNNLIPTNLHKKEFTGLGSEVELDFHIENAALKFIKNANFSPLGLLLTGVCFDENGPLTRLSDSREALSLLSGEDIDILRSPLFEINIPYRWRSAFEDNKAKTHPVPMLRGDFEMPDVSAAFYSQMVTPLSDEATQALKRFHEAIKKVSFGLEIKPGQLVYIDNRFTLHSRDAFSPIFNSEGIAKRWLQRVFIAPNLWHHRQLNSIKARVFEPISLEY